MNGFGEIGSGGDGLRYDFSGRDDILGGDFGLGEHGSRFRILRRLCQCRLNLGQRIFQFQMPLLVVVFVLVEPFRHLILSFDKQLVKVVDPTDELRNRIHTIRYAIQGIHAPLKTDQPHESADEEGDSSNEINTGHLETTCTLNDGGLLFIPSNHIGLFRVDW